MERATRIIGHLAIETPQTDWDALRAEASRIARLPVTRTVTPPIAQPSMTHEERIAIAEMYRSHGLLPRGR